jgi:gamma-glutamyl hercynylcysteine S-oxide synthase
MHGEAFTYTRQTLALPPPRFSAPWPEEGPALSGDVRIEGGRFELGAPRDLPFVFDNEKWAHEVEVRPFALARVATTTQGQFADFVDDGGYRRRELWSDEGWAWRERAGATGPLDWRDEGGTWLRRVYDRWLPIARGAAMVHVNWHEARAWCRWAKRRLPTEAEWELAASSGGKRLLPWGSEPPDPARASLDGRFHGPVDASALAAGDTPSGLRQMLGNVWEWCEDSFLPYPEFAPDPYSDYSAPWFGTHRVLRGGCSATRARLIRTTWRNFYLPHRRDVFAGFRSAAPAI